MIKTVFNLKIWTLIIALFAGFTFTSCDKDDDDNDNDGSGNGEGNIVGIWKYSDVELVDIRWGVAMPSEYKKMMEEMMKEEMADAFATMECTSSGKMDFGAGYYVDTYVLDGNKITIYEAGATFYGTYSVTGNKLQINLDLVKSMPEIAEMCDAFIVGLIFTRIGNSTRSASVVEVSPVLKEEKGILQTLVSTLKSTRQ